MLRPLFSFIVSRRASVFYVGLCRRQKQQRLFFSFQTDGTSWHLFSIEGSWTSWSPVLDVWSTVSCRSRSIYAFILQNSRSLYRSCESQSHLWVIAIWLNFSHFNFFTLKIYCRNYHFCWTNAFFPFLTKPSSGIHFTLINNSTGYNNIKHLLCKAKSQNTNQKIEKSITNTASFVSIFSYPINNGKPGVQVL